MGFIWHRKRQEFRLCNLELNQVYLYYFRLQQSYQLQLSIVGVSIVGVKLYHFEPTFQRHLILSKDRHDE